MRYPLLLMGILFAAQQVFALTAQEQQQAEAEAAPQVEAGDAEDTRERSPVPATDFTPSEQIEADSAVSFPVDI